MNQAIPIRWDGLTAVRLESDGCRALLVPALGSNLLSLRVDYDGQELSLLRSPRYAHELLADPFAYGIPVLFPPNRIAGAGYDWDGVSYRFPMNGHSGMHMHGPLHTATWRLADCGIDQDRAWARTELDSQADDLRTCFPVALRFALECSIAADGLTQRFTVWNDSPHEVPFGLAYHTALNVVFRPGGRAATMRLHVPVDGCCPDETDCHLPTGAITPLDEIGSALANPAGIPPLSQPLDALYHAQRDCREAVLREESTGLEVVYRAGPDVRHWIVWNRGATEGFVAVEPQTWLSNSIHLPDPTRHGVLLLPPGGSWTGETSLLVRKRLS